MWGGHPDVPGGSLTEHDRVTHKTIVIRLELQAADESLTGRASDGSGAAKEFVGWLGLVTAIDGMLPWSSPAPKAADSIGNLNEGGSS
jgi:hypothetical protein